MDTSSNKVGDIEGSVFVISDSIGIFNINQQIPSSKKAGSLGVLNKIKSLSQNKVRSDGDLIRII